MVQSSRVGATAAGGGDDGVSVCCYGRHLRSFTMYLLPATKNNKSQVKLLLFEALRNKSCDESRSKVFPPHIVGIAACAEIYTAPP